MKVRVTLLMCLVVTMLLCFPRGVSAHILETDGTIGGLLHIDPDDNPSSGQESTIFVELKDKQNTFTPKECSCTYTILRSGELLTTQPLFQNTQSDLTAHISYMFPEKNVYTLEIRGTPINAATFQPFLLRYTIRVENERTPAMSDMRSPSTSLRVFILVPLGILITIVLFLKQRKGGKK